MIEDMDYEPWGINIERVSNGYQCYCYSGEGDYVEIIQEVTDNDISENDELVAMYHLLHKILDYFCQGGNKHDPERLTVKVLRKGVDY